MRVVFTHGIANDTRRFPVPLIRVEVHLVHGKQDTPLYGFQAVAHIWQGACYNNAHGVVDVAFFHFLIDIYGDYLIYLSLLITHFFTSLIKTCKTLGTLSPTPCKGRCPLTRFHRAYAQ